MCGPGATLAPLRCFPVLLAPSAAQFQWLLFRVPSPPPPGKGLAGSPVTPGLACAGLHLWAYPEVGEGHSHVGRDIPTCRGCTETSPPVFACLGPCFCTPWTCTRYR